MVDEIWFSSQIKIIHRKMTKAFFMGALIFSLLGTGFGYLWCYKVEESEIKSLKAQVDHYKDNWMPIKEKETRLEKKRK